MNYWKLKSQILEAKLLEEKVNTLIAKIDEIKKRAAIEAGLDPDKRYNMNDEKETVTEVIDESKTRT